MALSWQQFIIVCPLVFLAGMVDAIAGGGGLISLPAYLIAGLPTHFAIATNKCSSSMGTTMATWRYAQDGYIPWRQAACCVGCAILGSCGGAQLALHLSDAVFQVIMLVILPLTAAYVLLGRSLDGTRPPYSLLRTTLLSMGVALVIGVYDGFYGPGTGTFLLLFLTGVAHMELAKANGVTKVINLTTNLSALAVYLYSGKVLLLLGVTAGLFSIAGNYVGTRFFDRGGKRFVKPVMLLVLMIFFAKVLLEQLGVV